MRRARRRPGRHRQRRLLAANKPRGAARLYHAGGRRHDHNDALVARVAALEIALTEVLARLAADDEARIEELRIELAQRPPATAEGVVNRARQAWRPGG